MRELALHGYAVRACIRDISTWRGADAVQYLLQLPGVEIVDGCDLFKPGSYHEAFAGCSAVFHAGRRRCWATPPAISPTAAATQTRTRTTLA